METENVTSAPAGGEVAQGGAAPEAQPVERAEPRDDNERATEANEARQQTDDVETETNAEGEEVATEEFELDVAGTKHRFPKGTPIEQALEKVQAYSKGLEAELTRKSQAVAEKTKAVVEAEKVVQRLQTMGFERAKDIARGQQLAEFVASYDTPDGARYLQTLWQSNPDQARQLSDNLTAARSEFSQIEARVRQYGEELNQAGRQAAEAQMKQTEQVVAKAIKGWNAQTEAKLIEYAVKNGADPQEAKEWRKAPAATVLAVHKAMLWDEMQAKAAAATKTTPPPAPATPITAPKAKAANRSVDLDKMSMDEYVAYRERQEGRRK